MSRFVWFALVGGLVGALLSSPAWGQESAYDTATSGSVRDADTSLLDQAASVSGSSFSFPFPAAVPGEAGELLAPLWPRYLPTTVQDAMGVGWRMPLYVVRDGPDGITRYDDSDEFTSPFGRFVADGGKARAPGSVWDETVRYTLNYSAEPMVLSFSGTAVATVQDLQRGIHYEFIPDGWTSQRKPYRWAIRRITGNGWDIYYTHANGLPRSIHCFAQTAYGDPGVKRHTVEFTYALDPLPRFATRHGKVETFDNLLSQVVMSTYGAAGEVVRSHKFNLEYDHTAGWTRLARLNLPDRPGVGRRMVFSYQGPNLLEANREESGLLAARAAPANVSNALGGWAATTFPFDWLAPIHLTAYDLDWDGKTDFEGNIFRYFQAKSTNRWKFSWLTARARTPSFEPRCRPGPDTMELTTGSLGLFPPRATFRPRAPQWELDRTPMVAAVEGGVLYICDSEGMLKQSVQLPWPLKHQQAQFGFVSGTTLVDLNGDQMSDVVEIGDGFLAFAPNQTPEVPDETASLDEGYRWSSAFGKPGAIRLLQAQRKHQHLYGDINGDGATDILELADGEQLVSHGLSSFAPMRVWFNNGTDATGHPSFGDPSVYLRPFKGQRSTYTSDRVDDPAQRGWGTSQCHFSLLDVDGDAHSDLFMLCPANRNYVAVFLNRARGARRDPSNAINDFVEVAVSQSDSYAAVGRYDRDPLELLTIDKEVGYSTKVVPRVTALRRSADYLLTRISEVQDSAVELSSQQLEYASGSGGYGPARPYLFRRTIRVSGRVVKVVSSYPGRALYRRGGREFVGFERVQQKTELYPLISGSLSMHEDYYSFSRWGKLLAYVRPGAAPSATALYRGAAWDVLRSGARVRVRLREHSWGFTTTERLLDPVMKLPKAYKTLAIDYDAADCPITKTLSEVYADGEPQIILSTRRYRYLRFPEDYLHACQATEEATKIEQGASYTTSNVYTSAVGADANREILKQVRTGADGSREVLLDVKRDKLGRVAVDQRYGTPPTVFSYHPKFGLVTSTRQLGGTEVGASYDSSGLVIASMKRSDGTSSVTETTDFDPWLRPTLRRHGNGATTAWSYRAPKNGTYARVDVLYSAGVVRRERRLFLDGAGRTVASAIRLPEGWVLEPQTLEIGSRWERTTPVSCPQGVADVPEITALLGLLSSARRLAYGNQDPTGLSHSEYLGGVGFGKVDAGGIAQDTTTVVDATGMMASTVGRGGMVMSRTEQTGYNCWNKQHGTSGQKVWAQCDGAGNPIDLQATERHVTVRRDDLGRLKSVLGEESGHLQLEFQADTGLLAGRRKAVRGRETRRELNWTADGQLADILFSEERPADPQRRDDSVNYSFQYDSGGRLTNVINGAIYSRTQTYDDLGRPTARLEIIGQGPTAARSEIQYEYCDGDRICAYAYEVTTAGKTFSARLSVEADLLGRPRTLSVNGKPAANLKYSAVGDFEGVSLVRNSGAVAEQWVRFVRPLAGGPVGRIEWLTCLGILDQAKV